VANRLGYSVHNINAMKHDFLKAIQNQQIGSSHFFVTHSPGTHIDTHKAGARERIIQLRKENYSILDIKSVLPEGGYRVSNDYIHRVLNKEGFVRLNPAVRYKVRRKKRRI